MSTGFERIGKDSELQDHWLRRIVAFIIDFIIVGACALVVWGVIWMLFVLAAVVTGFHVYMSNPFLFSFIVGLFSVPYFAFLESYFEGTFGKKIMRLGTIRLDGQKPRLDVAFVRNASKIYWVLVLIDALIGFATPGDPRQKASDRIAGTIVVSTGVSPMTALQTSRGDALYCSNCGKRLSAGVRYCPYCGRLQE